MIDEIAVLGLVHKLAVSVAYVHEVIVDHILRVIDALLFLPLCARSKELTAASRSRAAGDALLFHDNNISACKLRLNGCGKTARACTAHDDIHRAHLVLIIRSFRSGSRLERRYIVLGCACRLERCGCRVYNSRAGQVCAVNRGDIQRLVLHDKPREKLHRGCVESPCDASVFLVLRHLYSFYPVFGHRNVYEQLAAVAAPDAFVCSGIIACHIFVPPFRFM